VPVHQVCDQGPPPRCRFEVLTEVDHRVDSSARAGGTPYIDTN
jgi:hypothetical protein